MTGGGELLVPWEGTHVPQQCHGPGPPSNDTTFGPRTGMVDGSHRRATVTQ